MSASLLVHEFDRLVDQADSIERLRPFIVELGLRGLLVDCATADRSDDEHRRARIALGMQALTQSRPRYRWKPGVVAPRSDELLPGWVSVPLGDTGLFVNGIGFKAHEWGTQGTPIVRIQNLSGGSRDYNYAQGDYPADNVVNKGDLLVSWSATLDTFVWDGPQAVVNQHIFKVIPNDEAVTSAYLYWLLKHEVRALAQSQHAHGLAMMHINRGPFLAHAVGIPPLAEQGLIVAKIDELMAMCDELLGATDGLASARDALRSACLSAIASIHSVRGEAVPAAPRILLEESARVITRPEHIDAIRDSILDLAVQGHLADQNSEDESASSWLARECPRTVRDPVVDDPDVRLPVGWEWVTVGRLASMVTSGSRGWAEYYSPTGAPFVRAQNIRFGRLRLDPLAHVSLPGQVEGSRTRTEVGDILVVITGAGVTNPAMLDVDLGEAYVSQHIGLIKLRSKAVAAWVLLCLMANAAGRKELVARAYGAGKPGLNLNHLRSLVIPLPPMAEQDRILAKVKELISVCDELEAALAVAQVSRANALEALLRDVLTDGSESEGANTPLASAG